jgi:protease I
MIMPEIARPLDGCRIAILATDGFEQEELFEPLKALRDVGAEVAIIAPRGGSIRGWNHTEWGDSVRVDMTVEQADSDSFDALVLPGGVMSPDRLRMDPMAVEFVRGFVEAEKPIAAICHGPWTLIEAGDPPSEALRGVRMTSYPSIRTDLMNAGADWIDEPVVVDGNLITSRGPQDLQIFNRTMIETFRHRIPARPR